MQEAGIIAIALFMAGVIFAAGRFTARLEALEAWRRECSARFDHVDQKLDHLTALVRGDT